MVALQDLASPVAAFVRDRCERGPKLEVPVNELYTAWRSWADDNGHVKLTKQVFGRDRCTEASRSDGELRWTADHADQDIPWSAVPSPRNRLNHAGGPLGPRSRAMWCLPG
jgi:Poxvirus D5 protein-like